MSKKEQRGKYFKGAILVAFLGVLLLSASALVKAQSPGKGSFLLQLAQSIGGEKEAEAMLASLGFVQSTDQEFGAFIESGKETGFTDVAISNDLVVSGITTLTGTTTVGNLTLGSQYVVALSFSAPTTSGSLAVLQNTGADKLCSTVELDITTAGQNQFDFAVGTSTAATSWAAGYANGLVGSTTVATYTPRIITQLTNRGINNATSTWKWGNGVYLLAGMNTRADRASSTDWTGMAGKMYVTCHTL